ncbi:hypothetical protein [Acidocella aminolytica]|uniref:hypothetical protein n=1 Tax=Acidocella aminolytica TaxID=33998 RepID=UPI0006629903|nr:hypothetical protein [Acidocella aminolytica]
MVIFWLFVFSCVFFGQFVSERLKEKLFSACFFSTPRNAAVHYERRMEIGSSSCRVTGVSSLNLARHPLRVGGLLSFG